MDDARGEPDAWDAVFFDIGGVLVSLPSIREGYVDAVTDFAADHDLDPERALADWRDRLGEHFAAGEGRAYRSAEAGYRRAFQSLVETDLADEDWLPAFREAVAAAREFEPGAVETVRELADAGLYVGVISDIDTAEAERLLADADLTDAVDGLTTSEAVGYKKPDQRMFADALERSGVDPGRSLYVGDRYEHDMQGGTEAGLRTVAYGGTAVEEVADEPGPDGRVGDPNVDFVVEDLTAVLAVVGADG